MNELKAIPLIRARDIPEGKCFVKKGGSYAYLRISDRGLNFCLGVQNDEGRVYGICYNGNLTSVDPETLVHPASIESMWANYISERIWERDLGIKSDG